MTYKNCSFDVQEESYKELKSVLAAQGIKLQDFFNTGVENYLLKFKDTSITLTDFIDNPDFTKFPPIPFQKGEIDRAAWIKRIESFDQNDPKLKQLVFDLQTVLSKAEKKEKYGITSVRIH